MSSGIQRSQYLSAQFLLNRATLLIHEYYQMSVRRKGLDGVASSQWTYLFQKALSSGSEWPDRDELLDVVYWGRQLLALFVGILFGVVPVNGMFGIGGYIALSTLLVHQFVVDEDYVGGFMELAKEGFGAAFATFMVAWITVYTTLQQA